MLGFGAIGQMALGETQQGSVSTSISADLPGAYSILGFINSDLGGSYALAVYVSADLAGTYSIFVAGAPTPVSADLLGAYTVANFVSADLAGGYAVLSNTTFARAPAGSGYSPRACTNSRPAAIQGNRYDRNC